jgi:organic hydroperoxide reductase OsmC/OhrA
MRFEQEYRVTAWWASGRTGLVKSSSTPNAIHFSSSPEFGGLEGRWTPEDLLLSSLASCFTVTFRVLAHRDHFEYTDLEVSVQATLGKTESGYILNEFLIRPTLTVLFDHDRERGMALLRKTQAVCLVSKALAATKHFEPEVAVKQSVAFGVVP